jgi:hypothetical protein
MLVTTSYRPSDRLERSAEQLARRFGAAFVHRRNDTIPRFWRRYGRQPVLCLTEEGFKLYAGGEEPVFFHPGSAAFRLKRLQRGEPDMMVEAAEAAPGDRVIDGTAGLASDAIVFSHVVGDTGSVTALESEPLLKLIVEEGLSRYTSDIPGLEGAMRRISVKLADHADYLRSLPDKSAEIVYLDPMFRQPVEESSAIRPLRAVANRSRLERETIEEACRVAAKTVVMKEHRDSGEFARLGFDDVRRSHSNIAYGVIRL